MKFIGIDVGGMSVKGGLVAEDGKILSKTSAPCNGEMSEEEIVSVISSVVKALLNDSEESVASVGGIGIGCPGSVYDEKGIVRYSCNLRFLNTPLAKLVAESTGISNVRLSNDANCAAYAETLFGAGRGAMNTVTVTLGTGVGTGIVADGRLLTGNRSAGAEGGHMQIDIGGRRCGCDKKGHYEAFASASALISETREACEKHPESLLAKLANENGIDGKTAFIAAKLGDKVANSVVKRYLKYVGMGLVNFANIFYPETIIIGGGISNEGDYVIKFLQRYVNRNVYGSKYNPKIKVVAATLKNDAGIIGAAALLAFADPKVRR